MGTDLNRNWSFKWELLAVAFVRHHQQRRPTGTRRRSPPSRPSGLRNFVNSRRGRRGPADQGNIDWHTYSQPRPGWPCGYTTAKRPAPSAPTLVGFLHPLGRTDRGDQRLHPEQASDLLASRTAPLIDWMRATSTASSPTPSRCTRRQSGSGGGFSARRTDRAPKRPGNRRSVHRGSTTTPAPATTGSSANRPSTSVPAGAAVATVYSDTCPDRHRVEATNPIRHRHRHRGRLGASGVPQATNSSGAKQLATTVSPKPTYRRGDRPVGRITARR